MEQTKKSKLQFDNPRIVGFEYKQSLNFDASKYKAIGVNFETNINYRDGGSALVSLKVKIGLDDETVPFMINATVEAAFRWENGLEESMVDRLLNVNAKTLLLSYLRPFISHITVDAGYPPFVLPFYDFSENED